MAISAYTGLMGSGKSYNAVAKVLIPAWRDGRQTYTNIPLDLELIKQHFDVEPIQFTIEEIQENETWFDQVENGSVVVLDECWELWPAGTTPKNIRLDQKEFLTKHRHKVGENGKIVEPVFVTQDLSQIASFVRNLVNTTFHHVKQDQVGQDKRFRVDVYSGAVTGQKPPIKRRIREFHGKYKEDVYRYYSSQTQSESAGHGDEQSTDKRANILKSPLMVAYAVAPIVLTLFVVFFGIPHLMKTFNISDEPEPLELKQGVTPADPSAPVNQPIEKPKPIKKLEPRLQSIKDLLDSSDIFISYSELYKIGKQHLGSFFYSFTFQGKDKSTSLKQYELERLNVAAESVNECLAFIVLDKYRYTVQCYEPSTNKEYLGFTEASSRF